MYGLTLKDKDYNRMHFMFADLADLTGFVVVALEHAPEGTKAEVHKVEEGEADAV